MAILPHIKHWLQTKIYNACLNIEGERERKQLNAILSKMSLHGNPLTIGKGYTIFGPQFMELGDSCRFGENAWLECVCEWNGLVFTPQLRIGDRFNMQMACHIGCVERIDIGNNVLLGSKVYITDHFHGKITKEDLELSPNERHLYSKPVKIGDNVWIGDNVCIMPGVTLGDNVIVGANAVVTHSFPANTVIAGVPAKVIKVLE